MTHSFHRSRLDEIDAAAPVQPVEFPTQEQVALLRRSLQWVRGRLKPRVPTSAEAPAPRRRTR